jgi:hypothetical protein
MPDEYVYRVVLKDGCRRPKENGKLREGDGVWLFGRSAPGILLRVHQVLPPLNEGEEAEIVVDLWTGEPPRLA